MWYLAFTLGLFGSLHCIGMCGPLAIAFCVKPNRSTIQSLGTGLFYNIGRTTTYAFMGLIFGLLGSLLVIADLQKIVSICLGLIIVMSFFISLNPISFIQSNALSKSLHQKVNHLLHQIMRKSDRTHPYKLGIVNGLLPCGLVYIALAGALTSGSVYNGVIFMALFGMGTIPTLLALTLGSQMASPHLRHRFKNIIPYIQLCFGIYLLYRGLSIDFNVARDFWSSIGQPNMCQ